MTIHAIQRIIKEVNKTHKGLGQLVGDNMVSIKARKCVLNVSPSGCGIGYTESDILPCPFPSIYCVTYVESEATDFIHSILVGDTKMFTSLTLAGLRHIQKDLRGFGGQIIIDDLGGEKSMWSRISTITVLANLVYGHHVDKITNAGRISIDNFEGAAVLNIQPVMMNSLVQSDEWIAVVRDKVKRIYHLIRPIDPKKALPTAKAIWGIPLNDVEEPKTKSKSYWGLIRIGLAQWSYGRVKEHVTDMLKACAALDDRKKVNRTDYKVLKKLMLPMQLEPYLVESYGFEHGRTFQNNAYCVLVELASHGTPTIPTIAVDYKVSVTTAERLIRESSKWCAIEKNSPKHVVPTPYTKEIMEICGIGQTW